MRVVMGIDAAWTDRNPSGVAVAVEQEEGRWTLAGAFASYADFLTAGGFQILEGTARRPLPSSLLAACVNLTGKRPDLVAVDMPLSEQPIRERRTSDDKISKAFGAKGCPVHSPSQLRPGVIADDLRADFARAGYPLCTREITSPGLMETYPHAALVNLTQAEYRLPYKVDRARNYWPKDTPEERSLSLFGWAASIAVVLEAYIAGADAAIDWPIHGRKQDKKAAEDKLDAIVCVVAAARALDGGVTRYGGDDDDAIWVPEHVPEITKRTLLPSSPYSMRAEMLAEVIGLKAARGAVPGLSDWLAERAQARGGKGSGN